MSVIPLSSLDRDSGEGPAETPQESAASRNAESNSKIDAVIESVMSKIPSAFDDDDKPPLAKKGLDAHLTENIAKHETAVEEREAFDRSKESRQTLNKAYKQFDANTAKTLDAFLAFHDELKRDPQGAGTRLAELYLHAGPFGLQDNETKDDKPDVWFDASGNRRNERRMDLIIGDALNSNERGEYEATKAQRDKLNEVWPGLPFDQQMKRLVEIDTRLRRDPITAAAQIAATYGLPVLPHQIEQHAERRDADALVTQAALVLPGFDQVRHAMADIIASPHFVSTGNAQQDLQNAYQIAAQQHQQTAAFNNWAVKQLEAIDKTDPALARGIVDTIFKDQAFQQHAAKTEPDLVGRFHAAMAWAKSKMSSTRRGVARAKRAAPVKSSSGAIAPGGTTGKGIDAAISAAMRDF